MKNGHDSVVLVACYVDSLLILSTHSCLVTQITNLLCTLSSELVFTVQQPFRSLIAYLVLCLKLAYRLCWSYGKESAKPVIPADGVHPKYVKKDVVDSLILNALRRSCVHEIMVILRIVFFPL